MNVYLLHLNYYNGCYGNFVKGFLTLRRNVKMTVLCLNYYSRYHGNAVEVFSMLCSNVYMNICACYA